MKTSFLKHRQPLLVSMIQAETPEKAVSDIVNSNYDGAEAFGFQICRLKPEFRTAETYRRIFSYTEDKPVYITNYRAGHNVCKTDMQLAEELLLALENGATLCDIMGDFFDPSPFELTNNSEAVEKQKKLIDDIHSRGGEVLMSSHIHSFLKEKEVLDIAKTLESRGADIVKIVTASNTEEELLENLKASVSLKKELKVPFLFLSTGPYCKIHRMIGPMFGSMMYLCVYRHDELSTKVQPVLKNVKAVVDNFDWKPFR
ncbi:MAG: type I 3-dehydroquinate dehydratase [Caldicoprobacterales bacterium]|jgi:3-dehydroquinate dehydratase type I|nr:type I 3-dehydroquinate dehydratase [Clostridiales bacterium]